MRDILFKAKLKDWKTNSQRNKWVEGFYLNRKETTYCFAEDYASNPVKLLHYIAVDSMTDWGLPNEFRLFEIDPNTVCQYTGITIKDNIKLWEYDIVSVGVDLAIILYSDKYSGFILAPIGDYYFDSPMLIDNVDIINKVVDNNIDKEVV